MVLTMFKITPPKIVPSPSHNYFEGVLADRKNRIADASNIEDITVKVLQDCKRITSKQFVESRGSLRYIYYVIKAVMPDGTWSLVREIGPYKYRYDNKEEEANARKGAKLERDLELWALKELKASLTV